MTARPTSPPPRRRHPFSEAAFPALFLYPGLLFLAALSIYPTVYALVVSFQSYYLPRPDQTRWVGLGNYAALFDDPQFWNSASVTVRYVVIGVALQMVLGFAIALLLHSKLYWSGLWRTAVLIPMILAPVVVGTIGKNMFNAEYGVVAYLLKQVGIQSRYLGGHESALWTVLAVEVWQWTPFVALICLAALATLPTEVFEAASVDGANAWQTLLHVTLPLMRPYLAIAFVLKFIIAYKVFDPLFIMTAGGPGVTTQVLSLRVYETAFRHFQIGEGTALAFLVLLVGFGIGQFFVRRVLASEAQP
jgi:multiple sugar transport system permease protein